MNKVLALAVSLLLCICASGPDILRPAVDGVLVTRDGTVLVYYPCGRGVTFDQYGRAENAVDYAIPEGIETIGDSAFSRKRHLKSVAIPESVPFAVSKSSSKVETTEPTWVAETE